MRTNGGTEARLKQLLHVQTFSQDAYPSDEYAREFGISVDPRMMEVESRILPPPPVSAEPGLDTLLIDSARANRGRSHGFPHNRPACFGVPSSVVSRRHGDSVLIPLLLIVLDRRQ